jgi:hypothetical protein
MNKSDVAKLRTNWFDITFERCLLHRMAKIVSVLPHRIVTRSAQSSMLQSVWECSPLSVEVTLLLSSEGIVTVFIVNYTLFGCRMFGTASCSASCS